MKFHELGFDSKDEYNEMINRVPQTTPSEIEAFTDWQENDGTYVGLLNLLDAKYVIQKSLLDQVTPKAKKIKQARKRKSKLKVKDFTGKKLVGKYLMLGAGRQASAIAEMVVGGVLPKVDAAIFADTGNEPDWVYAQVWHLAERLDSVGIPLYIVHRYSIDDDIVTASMNNKAFVTMPIYYGLRGNKKGILKRQCTNEWKIVPSTSFLRSLLVKNNHATVASDGSRRPHSNIYVECWFGFGAEEGYRRSDNSPNWQKRVYPLIENGWTTADALHWLETQSLPIPKESSCLICPYHGDDYWCELYLNRPEYFEQVCQFDDWLRTEANPANKQVNGVELLCYLHSSCIPMREIDWIGIIEKRKEAKKHRQTPMFAQEVLFDSCRTDGGFSCMS